MEEFQLQKKGVIENLEETGNMKARVIEILKSKNFLGEVEEDFWMNTDQHVPKSAFERIVQDFDKELRSETDIQDEESLLAKLHLRVKQSMETLASLPGQEQEFADSFVSRMRAHLQYKKYKN
ncbi:hypothetical protein HYT05_02330 [Candidatus Kaiserbacteria bacterium]|nr:hypothetical protein [Candidatus Kaiserbacteria bacterium]